MILVLYILLFVYFLAIMALIYGFTKVNSFEYLGLKPKTKFSIVVPFRNESQNLPKLLESFDQLKYPADMFEVILVDDASDFKFQISDFRFQTYLMDTIRVSNSPKKDAITTAMQSAKNDWILTTDADCIAHENWLALLDNYIQLHSVSMIAGAVRYECKNTFLHHFQQLDLASLQGATMGSFGLRKGFMCNGANFAYTKSFFQELKGFDGNDGIASGDDVFLLQKAMVKAPSKVHYLKSENNIIVTKPLNDWKSLFHQRVRWASKTGAYQSKFGIGLGLIVFGGNTALLCVVFGFLFQNYTFSIVLFFFLAKWVIDFILLQKTNQFFKSKTQFFITASLLYPLFSVSVALYAAFGKYEWKGRGF